MQNTKLGKDSPSSKRFGFLEHYGQFIVKKGERYREKADSKVK